MIWNTDYIVNIISDSFPDHKIRVYPPSGDCDTECVTVIAPEEHAVCRVFGMVDVGEWVENNSKCEISRLHVVLTQKYGMESASANDMLLIAKVRMAIEKEGFKCTSEGWEFFF